ncbi:MAG: FtsL-like putative cell division protein [Crocinitomicaceae bacterium]|jgi:ABC-type transport system involved in cytochrome bd biosynthesis fused ATPase/permease subunit|nr:FtsL-like putative cell division protein [Crocinitomicaceae bacterium]
MAKSQATPPKNRKGSKANAFAQILNGEFLTKSFVLDNLNYIFFIMLLLLLLISKGYYGKQLTKDTDAAQRNLDQHSAEFIEAKARLELVTRRFKMAERLESRELKETKNATKVIRIKEKINE